MSSKTPSFEQAIEIAAMWCKAWENEEISDEVIAERISELILTPDGARGFFVLSLASDCPLIDRLPDPLVMKLREAGEPIVDITVRNLAMSTAMQIHHLRESNEIARHGSERVTARCREILKILDPYQVKERLQKLLNGLKGKGEDVQFLNRWNYDSEQKDAISQNINSIAEN